ncbi:uncharacterized protein LOC135217569 [Macrobrachium nipponense]|uniref:uncharacterized protein LOC135217569 n=1 Tax=Macrobrachium nipponense TaxID=159736 RepID=UPI0030C827CD
MKSVLEAANLPSQHPYAQVAQPLPPLSPGTTTGQPNPPPHHPCALATQTTFPPSQCLSGPTRITLSLYLEGPIHQLANPPGPTGLSTLHAAWRPKPPSLQFLYHAVPTHVHSVLTPSRSNPPTHCPCTILTNPPTHCPCTTPAQTIYLLSPHHTALTHLPTSNQPPNRPHTLAAQPSSPQSPCPGGPICLLTIPGPQEPKPPPNSIPIWTAHPASPLSPAAQPNTPPSLRLGNPTHQPLSRKPNPPSDCTCSATDQPACPLSHCPSCPTHHSYEPAIQWPKLPSHCPGSLVCQPNSQPSLHSGGPTTPPHRPPAPAAHGRLS